jgi:hypothetical protein
MEEKTQIFFSTQDDLSFFLCLLLCKRGFLCYGIPREDLENYTNLT